MRKKIIALCMTAVLVIAGNAGCKNGNENETAVTISDSGEVVTSSHILEAVISSIESADSISSLLQLEASVSYAAEGTESDMMLSGTYAMKQIQKNGDFHSYGTTKYDLGDAVMENEIYVVHDAGAAKTYERNGNYWTVKDGEDEASGSLAELLSQFKNHAEDCEMTADAGCYQISGNLKAKEISSFLNGAAALPAAWSADEKIPVVIRATKEGTLVSLVASFAGGFSEAGTDELAALELDSFQVNSVLVSVSQVELNQVAEIHVPEDVVAYAKNQDQEPETESEAEEEYETPETDEDGYITLGNEWGDETIKVSVPDGFAFQSLKNNKLIFVKKGTKELVTATYILIPKDETFGERELSQLTDKNYATMKASQDYSMVSCKAEELLEIGDRDVKYKRLTWLLYGTIYSVEYDAWTVLSEGRMVRVIIQENSWEKPCSQIEFKEDIKVTIKAIAE